MKSSAAVRAILLIFAASLLFAGEALAGSGQVWVIRSRPDFADARFEGTTLSADGRVTLSPAITRVSEVAQSFVWCLAADPNGRVYAGGGNEGGVFRVGSGGAEMVFHAPEIEVHAIAFDSAGRLYAGTSPEGKVYRVDGAGKGEVFFDPKATYIWAIAFDASDNLLVATGGPAKIFRIAKSGKADTLLEAREDHIRSLVADGSGGWYAGSDQGGVVYRVSPEGKATVLYDTPAREIAALAVMGGDVYAAALSPVPRGSRGGVEMRRPVTRVTVTAEGGAEVQDEGPSQGEAQPQRQQPPPDVFQGSIYRIGPDGYGRKVWESREHLPLSLAAVAGRVIVGTGDTGKLIAVTSDGDPSEIGEVEASQVNALLARPGGLVLAGTSNLGAVFQMTGSYAAEGTITSGVRDAGFTSKWGALTWLADVPSGTGVSFEARSGDTEDPDGTWSAWSSPLTSPDSSVVDRPAARYVQWRARLTSKGSATPVLKSIQLAYLQENMPPEIESVEILPPGAVLQPTGPSGSPDDGSDTPAQRRAIPPKRSFQKGMRSASWKSSDANGDALRAEVLFKAEDETVWRTLKSEVEEDFLSWDSTAMPDGVYRLRIIVSDAASSPQGRGLKAQRDSAPFDVDNTPPVVSDVKARFGSRSAVVTAGISDTFSAIGDLAYSVDAGDWTVVYPQDGVADTNRESLSFTTAELTPGEHSIVIRARDRSGNVSSGKVVVRVP